SAKQQTAAADAVKVTPATVDTTKYQEALELQKELTAKAKEYSDLVTLTEAKIAIEPASRAQALQALITEGQKILATMESLRARNKDLLPLLPGPTPLQPVGGVTEERWKAYVPLITSMAQGKNVDPLLALATFISESKLDPNAKSKAGAL